MSRSVYRQSDGIFTVVAEKRASHESYRIRAWYRGQKPATEAQPTETLAKRAARAIWDAYLAGELTQLPPPETLGELWARYSERQDVPERARRSWAAQSRAWLRLLGESTPLHTLSREVLRMALAQSGLALSSQKILLIRGRQAIRWAAAEGWMDGDITERLQIAVPRQPIRPWLSYGQWPTLLAAIKSPKIRLRVEFLLETGLRSGEAFHLRESALQLTALRPFLRVDVDPIAGWQPKSARSTRAVPLSARAVELAKQAISTQKSPCGLLFGTVHSIGTYNALRDAAKEAGLGEMDLHGLRRSAGARWLEAGVPLLLVSEWLGHASVAITQARYAGISAHLTAQAIGAVDAHAEAWQTGAVTPLHDTGRDKKAGRT